ncbi:cell cycle regulator of non-homologous end joining isoform X1 [Desmodus rotundus]|uniref:cell cycle regulator of non-homologous end joining isoform X1 n=1 Tax=Desmodus rotundus TaxID=9430 RepID=UPI002380EA29|nr:cell cycle regulator of non-homologous end joining isoform X1 [Desmodus rotundus]XP_053782626.1 cell cycle regulator of non-homologous end joining isoform X1 [Desmodus rotundus]XP_053782627.1 cell cycle regulator of non-homologous end joining isoform X1 [Desmodus rotundus]XP_053782628.1 cell cycle regulator of non-homologous end joining isoform X1 [Desmodus rotundus]XP_053782629.1 cell cycle regulator of non-homologous end joining isoform X1 [Desmodus rotundus]
MREMEALNSGDKKRVLPTWMTAQEPEKRMRLVKTPKRRKMAVVPAAAVRPPAVKTVYCMSEAELVDVALGVLIQVESAVSVLTVLTAHSSPAEARLGPWLTSLEQMTCVLRQPQGALSPVCLSSTCPLSQNLSWSPPPLGWVHGGGVAGEGEQPCVWVALCAGVNAEGTESLSLLSLSFSERSEWGR